MLFQNTLHLGHTAFFFLTKPFLLCKCSYSRVEIVFWNFKTPKSHIDELDGFLAPPLPGRPWHARSFLSVLLEGLCEF